MSFAELHTGRLLTNVTLGLPLSGSLWPGGGRKRGAPVQATGWSSEAGGFLGHGAQVHLQCGAAVESWAAPPEPVHTAQHLAFSMWLQGLYAGT